MIRDNLYTPLVNQTLEKEELPPEEELPKKEEWPEPEEGEEEWEEFE